MKARLKLWNKMGNSIFRIRFLLGLIDIPQIEIVLTTKCSLRCESCSNLMQYFSRENQFSTSLQSIKSSMDKILNNIASINIVRILGGEPLLFKELPSTIDYLISQPKIRSIELITNATINFNPKLLSSLKHHKVRVIISNYSSNPLLESVLKHKQIVESLVSHRISYIFWHTDSHWRDIGKIYKRNRTQTDIRQNFLACKMPCVSLLCEDKDKNSEAIISVCPIASALTQLKSQNEFDGDFVRIDSKDFRRDIMRFYAQDFYKACDYCPNKWEEATPIPPALQTKATLKLEA